MNLRESSYGTWSSLRGFLFVAGGAAMGIGGMARLPYLAGEYGGAVFWAAYLLALVLLGWPLLVAELMLGRWTRDDLVTGLRRLAQAAHAGRFWGSLGALALVCCALILSYYSVIAGWSMAYTLRAASGMLNGVGVDMSDAIFFELAQDPERSLAWHTIFIATACVIVAHGARDGIERAASYLAPAAFMIAGALFVYALSSGGAGAALDYLWTPRWERFGWRGLLEAFHQAFFTLGLGLGVMYGFGNYLPSQTSLPRIALGVIAADTLFSILAGTALFALVFNAGVSPAQGVALSFQVLPRALPQGFTGVTVATLVYLMTFMVTLLAAMALLEPPTRWLMDRYRITRVFAAAYSAIVIWYLGIATLLSFNVIAEWRALGWNTFDWLQWLTSRLLVPAAVFLICTFIVRIVSPEFALAGWGERDRRLFVYWRWLLTYPVRVALLAVLLYSIGLVDLLVGLWV